MINAIRLKTEGIPMNGNWTDYRINQLHRQEKLRQAEMHRLGQTVEAKNSRVSHRLDAIFASLLALVG
jgi:hypothetical protein